MCKLKMMATVLFVYLVIAVQQTQAENIVSQAQTPSLADLFESVVASIVHVSRPNSTGKIDDRHATLESGTGFIVHSSGLIATNEHLLDGANQVAVILSDGKKYSAELVGKDRVADIAVLRLIDGPVLSALQWANSDDVRSGDSVFIAHNMMGRGVAVTDHIVAHKPTKPKRPLDDFIQIYPDVLAGGAPVFNKAGKVVGIATARWLNPKGGTGYSFAIPSSLGRAVIEQILRSNEAGLSP